MSFHRPFKQISFVLSPVNIELVRRFVQKDKEAHELETDLNWLDCLKPVSTRTAFRYAEDGQDVFMIYADGTDSQLDDLETEREYYPDLSKSWPKIETIFVVEETK